jgi:hypothetical protein
MHIIRNVESISQLRDIRQTAEQQGLRMVYLGDRSIRLVKDNLLEKGLAQISGQLKRENHRLDAFVNQIRRQESLQRGQPLPDRQTRIQLLVGQPIAAHVAVRFMGEVAPGAGRASPSQAQFDHAGRFLGLSTQGRALSELELADIEDSVQAKNSAHARETARVDREILLDMMFALDTNQPASNPEQSKVMEAAMRQCRQGWLRFDPQPQASGNLLRSVAKQFQAVGLADLAQKATALAREADIPKHSTQLHDNAFGREFETRLVDQLVDQPPAAALRAAHATGQYLHQQLQAMTADESAQALTDVASALRSDHRPWTSEVAELAAFMEQPTLDNYRQLMTPQAMTGYHLMATTLVGVKTALAMAQDTPWIMQANDNYLQWPASTILAARRQLSWPVEAGCSYR